MKEWIWLHSAHLLQAFVLQPARPPWLAYSLSYQKFKSNLKNCRIFENHRNVIPLETAGGTQGWGAGRAGVKGVDWFQKSYSEQFSNVLTSGSFQTFGVLRTPEVLQSLFPMLTWKLWHSTQSCDSTWGGCTLYQRARAQTQAKAWQVLWLSNQRNKEYFKIEQLRI